MHGMRYWRHCYSAATEASVSGSVSGPKAEALPACGKASTGRSATAGRPRTSARGNGRWRKRMISASSSSSGRICRPVIEQRQPVGREGCPDGVSTTQGAPARPSPAWRSPWFGTSEARRIRCRRIAAASWGNSCRPDLLAFGENHGAEHRIFELADVARPARAPQERHARRRRPSSRLCLPRRRSAPGNAGPDPGCPRSARAAAAPTIGKTCSR